MPENRAKTAREHWIETELVYGCVSERVSKSGSMFETDEERRAAWLERKDELMEKQYTGQPRSNGNRPWAWWEYESGRPELRSEPPEPPTSDVGWHTSPASATCMRSRSSPTWPLTAT